MHMHLRPVRLLRGFYTFYWRGILSVNMFINFYLFSLQMESNNHFNYGTHSSANSGLKLSSGDSLYTNGSSMSFPQQGKSEYFQP